MKTILALLVTIPILAGGAEPELLRTLHEGSNFNPPTTLTAWQKRATYLRQQVLIAAGLWPMPDKTPLNAQIYGLVDRGDYTIEKVHFESYPGFFVTGNLYRPKNRTGPFPAVLSPHGHWENGRLYEATPQTIEQQLKGGWETDTDAARYPMQARAANLAKLGCIVFFYDMVGYADAAPDTFLHRKTYRDIDSDLRLLSVFGLQTWDSIRAVDFVCSLPDVDRTRIGCTGASGGATQTFMLMAIDDRLTAAAPVCMISAGDHQGGCVCENNSLLRVGTDNVELTSTFAPRPFIHPTATADWTKDYLEHGFPQTRAVYALFGVPDNVTSFRQTAQHNYNRTSREAVYNFLNKHLKLGGIGAIAEQDFKPVAPRELSVWDADHPRPANAITPNGLKQFWIDLTARQMDALKPTDAASLQKLRECLEPALQHMVSSKLPRACDIAATDNGQEDHGDFLLRRFAVRRVNDQHGITAALLTPKKRSAEPPLLYLSRKGNAALLASSDVVKSAVERTVLLIDAYDQTAPAPPPATSPAIEFFAGYNRTPLARRVHDTLTAIAFLTTHENVNAIEMTALDDAAPWCLLAKALAGDAIQKTTVNGRGWKFDVSRESDPNYLPGSLRYGVGPLAALCAPEELTITGPIDAHTLEWLGAAYHAANADGHFHYAAHD